MQTPHEAEIAALKAELADLQITRTLPLLPGAEFGTDEMRETLKSFEACYVSAIRSLHLRDAKLHEWRELGNVIAHNVLLEEHHWASKLTHLLHSTP